MVDEVRTPIRGKVARVLSTRELAINRGSSDGVRVGMVFTVLDPNGEQIRDPETGLSLGSLRRPKVSVRVKHAEDRVALCETFESTKVNLGGSGGVSLSNLSAIASMFQPPRVVVRYRTLRQAEAPWEPMDEADSFVKTGDPVEEVIGGEAIDVLGTVETPSALPEGSTEE
jgi:hypothetical protein